MVILINGICNSQASDLKEGELGSIRRVHPHLAFRTGICELPIDRLRMLPSLQLQLLRLRLRFLMAMKSRESTSSALFAAPLRVSRLKDDSVTGRSTREGEEKEETGPGRRDSLRIDSG